MPLIQGLAGSKNELRVTWLKNDTTATSYKISGAPWGWQKWMAAAHDDHRSMCSTLRLAVQVTCM